MAEDTSRRSKLIETFWLFWAFNHRGIQNSILGPTILDLQLLLKKDLSALSYLFFANGLGAMLGALAAGFLASRFNLRLQLFLSLMVGSVSLAAIPQVHHIVYMYIMVFILGTTSGLVITFVMLICGKMWERRGPAFHFVACGMSTGAIIAPLLSNPFLCLNKTVLKDVNLTNALPLNSTRMGSVLKAVIPLQLRSQKTMCTADDTSVQWAFFVLGCCMLTAGLSQLYYWFVHRDEKAQQETKSSEYVELDPLGQLTPASVVFYISLCLMYFSLSSLPATFASLLTIYGVTGPLHVAKGTMTTITALFFIGSLSSRFISVFLTRVFTNYQVLITHLSGLVIVGIVFVSLGNRYTLVVWLCSISAGYLSGPFFAGVLAWVTDVLSMHSKVTSLCFLFSGAGIMLSPFAGGASV
ncbi:major facilitator superfamily domain-containing protein 4B-like [Haliotis rubra]|uniref:major facilitator superfamily domain-containing protein 4B-like n=1 Tax=Haliotis rubra TaxID=36100 RepID=UPI001EE58755|nr:major facilitator superfamily domain-containing protein 4B-like [Haliotis rubra]